MGTVAGLASIVAEFINRAPIAIIAFWLAVLVLLAPFSIRINEVVETRTEQLLPEEAESRVVQERLGEGYARDFSAARAILVVTGVDPSPTAYTGLSQWYQGFSERFGALSWIDAVELGKANISRLAGDAITNASQLYEGVAKLWSLVRDAESGLRDAVDSLTGLKALISESDRAYSETYSFLAELSRQVPAIINSSIPLDYLCNRVGPGYSSLYFDVVRAEALLETLTLAYEAGLRGEDIDIVVEASSLEAYGIGPLTRELIVLVFEEVAAMGGPERFDNLVASELASSLTKTLVPPEASPVVDLFSLAWASAVSGLPDLREPVKRDALTGQVILRDIIGNITGPVIGESAEALADSIVEASPSGLRPLIDTYLRVFINLGCTQERALEALETALNSYLLLSGVPEDYVALLSGQVVRGEVSRETIAAMISERALEEAGEVPGLSQEDLASILLSRDPEARGILYRLEEAALDAAISVLEERGIRREAVNLALSGRITEGALIIVREALKSEGEAEALRLLDFLSVGGFPGSIEEAVYKATGLVSLRISAEAGLDVNASKAIAGAAARVFLGVSSLEAEAEALTPLFIGRVVDEVVESLRGFIVESDGGGFLIALANVASLEDVKRAEEEVLERLATLGYTEAKVLALGDVVFEAEVREAVLRDLERSDRVSSVLVLAILAGIIGSIVAVVFPFIGIGMGLALAFGLVYIIASQGLVEVTSTSRALTFTTGLGLGIDYSAFVARKFRESIRGATGPGMAAAIAFKRSWRPVMAGAIAASVGFGSLALASDFPFIYAIGTNVPIAILLVMAISLTVTPALLSILGGSRATWWPTCPYKPVELGSGAAASMGSVFVKLSPLTLALVAATAIGAGLVFLEFEGNYDIRLNMPGEAGPSIALDIVAEEYSLGLIYPVNVITGSPEKASSVGALLEPLECVRTVEVNNDTVKVVLAVDPLTREAVRCAEEIRSLSKQVDPQSLVGGLPAINLDLRTSIYEVFYKRILPVAGALIFIVMLLFFGSIPAAVVSVAGIAVAGLWSVALMSFISEATGSLEAPWFLPIVVFAAILGVGMDYNSFFLGTAREIALRDPEGYVKVALNRGSALVLGLALIMSSAYAGLAISQTIAIRTTGLALALGVLLAGLNSAIILTPSLMSLLGRKFWWPLKIEGQKRGSPRS